MVLQLVLQRLIPSMTFCWGWVFFLELRHIWIWSHTGSNWFLGHLSSICSSWLLFCWGWVFLGAAPSGFRPTGSKLVLGDICLQFVLRLLFAGVGFFLELRHIWIWATLDQMVLGDICLQFVLLDYFLLGLGFSWATPYLDLEPHWIKIGSWGHLSSICSSWLLFAGVGFFLELRHIWIWSHTDQNCLWGHLASNLFFLTTFCWGWVFFGATPYLDLEDTI